MSATHKKTAQGQSRFGSKDPHISKKKTYSIEKNEICQKGYIRIEKHTKLSDTTNETEGRKDACHRFCVMSTIVIWKEWRHAGTDRLFLHSKNNFSYTGPVCYRNEPLAENTLRNFMKTISKPILFKSNIYLLIVFKWTLYELCFASCVMILTNQIVF